MCLMKVRIEYPVGRNKKYCLFGCRISYALANKGIFSRGKLKGKLCIFICAGAHCAVLNGNGGIREQIAYFVINCTKNFLRKNKR